MTSTSSAVDRLLDDGSGRRPRADARRNVERLVRAAREAAAEVGGEVTAHEIARRAGVGVGTFYRRVSTLELLLEAVLAEMVEEIVARGDEGLADPDPWAGFAGFAGDYIRLRNELCDINEAAGGSLDHARSELRDRIRLLVERAQGAGAMRADVTWKDVAFLLVSVSTTAHTLGLRAGHRQWDRNLQVVLDGLRSPEPAPLPGAPPEDANATAKRV
ncbi:MULTISPECIES: TetR/AcrR family transcriptional regulator [Actinomadura]|uniref:TetR family transcriptional regulator n=1 Tax=Actinomadura litoris TaxID=2678616 RepID=A0A7K1KV43_9ACTN|nr:MULTISPECIES: TetR family transcriptional regulator [Actinomadura]MBT2210983.1 TetR family transcriptional regulator [Actinomadura sp. NEAU-AAG7]MUN35905.1 TetR family transcriptional regulator [Actinomadura litoris]